MWRLEAGKFYLKQLLFVEEENAFIFICVIRTHWNVVFVHKGLFFLFSLDWSMNQLFHYVGVNIFSHWRILLNKCSWGTRHSYFYPHHNLFSRGFWYDRGPGSDAFSTCYFCKSNTLSRRNSVLVYHIELFEFARVKYTIETDYMSFAIT